jgi:hypothetical protein
MARCDSTSYFLKTSPSPQDDRDLKYQQLGLEIKAGIDLREFDSPVEDQEDLGSCVGSALTNAYEIMVKTKYPARFEELSDLYVYYNSRTFTGNTDVDSGACIRDGLRGMVKYGCCSEELWPYDITKFNVRPTLECYLDGARRLVVKYESLYTLRDILETLNSNDPVVVGIVIYDSFMDLDSTAPVVSMPSATDEPYGGHAMVLVGYHLARQQFLAKNSFGTDWGDQGYCWIPFEYMRTQAFEKWRFHINSQEPVNIDQEPEMPPDYTA